MGLVDADFKKQLVADPGLVPSYSLNGNVAKRIAFQDKFQTIPNPISQGR